MRLNHFQQHRLHIMRPHPNAALQQAELASVQFMPQQLAVLAARLWQIVAEHAPPTVPRFVPRATRLQRGDPLPTGRSDGKSRVRAASPALDQSLSFQPRQQLVCAPFAVGHADSGQDQPAIPPRERLQPPKEEVQYFFVRNSHGASPTTPAANPPSTIYHSKGTIVPLKSKIAGRANLRA